MWHSRVLVVPLPTETGLARLIENLAFTLADETATYTCFKQGWRQYQRPNLSRPVQICDARECVCTRRVQDPEFLGPDENLSLGGAKLNVGYGMHVMQCKLLS
jgi:hypothetical protein